MKETDTIAAISTPIAPAGIGVLRISGGQAVEIAGRVFRPASKTRELTELEGYTAAYGHVWDEQGDIDECVALVFRAPHSYTGEDVVELSCHGGLYLLQRTLRAVVEAGARPALAGEFTRRAFVNGKMDLTKAESVMDLIQAQGRLAAKAALSAREGVIFRRLEEIKALLIGLEAGFSAYVDYPDDDIPQLEPEALRQTLEKAGIQLQGLLDTFDAGRVLREGVETVIAGSPNVGKSTLMNWLAGCEKSIVTPVAGTTRDVVEEVVRVGEVVLRLADTAGIRTTQDMVEAMGVQRAMERLKRADLILAVFDGTRPLSKDDIRLLESLKELPAIALINKTDEPMKIDESYIGNYIKHTVFISAKKGEGLEELSRTIEEVTGIHSLSGTEPVLATERQRDCVRECLSCVKEGLAALDGGMTMDAVSVMVSGAIEAILQLTGERATEAVVNEIFSRFCVGK